MLSAQNLATNQENWQLKSKAASKRGRGTLLGDE